MSQRHPLELELNASAEDILTAVSRGSLTKVDVKGKLAELFLDRYLQSLVVRRLLESATHHDTSAKPDFVVGHRGRAIRIECKNARRGLPPAKIRSSPFWAEVQRTRNSKDGTLTRAYRADGFDVLAVCLFNHTNLWEFVFAPTTKLVRRKTDPDLLAVQQPVSGNPDGVWERDLLLLLERLPL